MNPRYIKAIREHDRRKVLEAEVEALEAEDREMSLFEILAIGGFVCFVTVLCIFALADAYGETVAAFLTGR